MSEVFSVFIIDYTIFYCVSILVCHLFRIYQINQSFLQVLHGLPILKGKGLLMVFRTLFELLFSFPFSLPLLGLGLSLLGIVNCCIRLLYLCRLDRTLVCLVLTLLFVVSGMYHIFVVGLLFYYRFVFRPRTRLLRIELYFIRIFALCFLCGCLLLL